MIDEATLRKTLSLRPGDADCHYNLGCVLAEAGRHEEAAEAFSVALRIHPQDAAALNNLGNSLLALERVGEAETAFSRAIKFDRRNPVIVANLASALNLMAVRLRNAGDEREAERLLRRALAAKEDFPEGWNNLAAVLHDLGRHPEAEDAVLRALTLRPGYVSAFCNLGNILIDTGRPAEARAAYERAAAAAPDSAAAHWNLGLACLALGDLERGFAEFEYRLRLPEARGLYPDRDIPCWAGENMAGRRLLLYAEQGLGDTLQFVRYVPMLAERGGEVHLEAPAALHRLLAGMPGLAGIHAAGEGGGGWDQACPLMSLPHRFGTTLETVPADIPYLHADPGRVTYWRNRLGTDRHRPAVGLVWAGEPRKGQPDAYRIDLRRSLRLDDLAPVLALEGIDFVSLQKGAGAAQMDGHPLAGRILDWTPELTDFAETAALAMNLDLIVTVDTSVAHLSGGLGRPTWVLSRFDGCWRWLLDRDDSPWYPTLRLFRQERPLDWAPAVARMAAELKLWREAWHA
ncbi:MAG: tetratricopeptide repeat protein [Rhodocyclaceae bacterium]|nr:tetratricopeptide repeat protein [Rhodocyclaceae bacterium]